MCGVPCVISDGPNAVSFMANELNKIGTYTFLCKTCVGTFVAFKVGHTRADNTEYLTGSCMNTSIVDVKYDSIGGSLHVLEQTKTP